MARTGFLATLAAVLFGAWQGAKRERVKAEEQYRRAVAAELQNHAAEQASFEAMMARVPALRGDGKFAQAVDLEFADRFALDAFTQYLDLTQDNGATIWATISFFGDYEDEPGQRLEVMVSEAELGYIPAGDEAKYFALLEREGMVKCVAKLAKTNGLFELHLDIAHPPRLKSQTH